MSYFKPLRRKFGVLTLGLACVFMSAWVRSLTIHEGIIFQASQSSDQRLISFQGAIHWCWLDGSSDRQSFPSVKWLSSPHRTNLMVINPARSWRWRFAGFGIHDRTYDENEMFTVLLIPYWSIVIPLTLLSAWLILSKPRTKQPPGTERAIIPPTSTGPDKDPAIASALEVAADY